MVHEIAGAAARCGATAAHKPVTIRECEARRGGTSAQRRQMLAANPAPGGSHNKRATKQRTASTHRTSCVKNFANFTQLD
jgi:hypothetical protein